MNLQEAKTKFDELRVKGFINLKKEEKAIYQECEKFIELDNGVISTPKKQPVPTKSSAIDNNLLKKLNKQISILAKAVDVNKLSSDDRSNFSDMLEKKSGMSLIRLNFWKGKLIKSHELIKDSVMATPKGLEEVQLYRLVLEDDTTVKVSLVDMKFKTQKVYECLETPNMNREGDYIYRVEYKGETLEIKSQFIN